MEKVPASAQPPACLHLLPADRDLSSRYGKRCEAATGPAAVATAGTDTVARRGKKCELSISHRSFNVDTLAGDNETEGRGISCSQFPLHSGAAGCCADL